MSINKIIWKFTLNKDLKIRDEKILRTHINKYLPKSHVEFEILERILNEKSGKFKYVKSLISKE